MSRQFPKQGLMILASCEMGCGNFWKRMIDYLRSQRHYCTKLCYLASVDRSALGRAGAAAPRYVSPAKRFARSQKGGLARAKTQTKERLSEIGRMGYRAGLAKHTKRQRSASGTNAANTTNRKLFGVKSFLGVHVPPQRKPDGK